MGSLVVGKTSLVFASAITRDEPSQSLGTMTDSPPHRAHPHHSLSSPIPLRSALKYGDSFSRASPPTSPPPIASAPPSVLTNPLTCTVGYTPKVGFDTFENPAASMFSFTLSAESVGYTRSLQTRVFLCAASPDESGSQALDWALDSLVQDGDELVVFRGFDEDILGMSLSLASYLDQTPEIVNLRECADVRVPRATAGDHDAIRDEARELLQQVQAKSVEYDPDRKVRHVQFFSFTEQCRTPPYVLCSSAYIHPP